MAITLRLTKGSELTFQELDDNFTDLNGRVSTLETSDATDISLTSLSVTTASAGTAGLSYNNTTGVFTYTPPDLSSYLTSVPAQSFASLTGKPTTIAGYGITDGYDDADVDSHLNQSSAGSNQVLSWNGSDYAWVAQSGGVALSDLSVTTASASGTPSLAYNNTTGVFTYTPPDLANAIVLQSQYTTTVTTNAADPTSTDNHVLGNTGTPSIHNSSTAWYYGDVVHDPANPTTSVVLDIDSGILTGDVVGDITSAGTSTFSGTVDFSASSNVDFTGATVSGLPNDTWATLGDKDGPGGPSQIALGTNAGNVNQGANSIAIGAQAGVTNQAATSIVINATGIVLDNAIPESFVVKPVRGLVTAQALYYDVATGEVTYGAAPSGGGGTFALAGNTGTHTFNTATETLTFLGTTGQINAGIAANNVTLELDPNINSIVSISFEGATADNFETKLQAVDPTADRTINLPDADGTVALLSDISGSGLPTRSTKTGNTNSLADAAEADLDITGFKAYALLAITTDRAARVRLYVSAATRTADASRAEGVDPTSDAGLIAEVITTGSETVTISPGAYGFNLESTPTTTIPCRVTNKSGGTATVQVTLNILQLEA